MFKIEDTPEEDSSAFDIISSGLNKGVFQLESNLAISHSKRFKPKNSEEVTNLISIIRPGSLPLAPVYLRRLLGDEAVSYIDDRLEPILKDTQGIILFQEQILKIVQDLAGYSGVESDILRRQIGKKKEDELKRDLPKLRQAFVDNGMEEDSADQLVQEISYSSSYGFNKSHARSYARLAIITAFFKSNYSIVFFWANLKMAYNKQDSLEEVRDLFYDAKKFDIDIIPPSLKDINDDFEIIGDNKIAFGFRSVKGLGDSGIKQLYRYKNADTWHKFLIQSIDKKIKKQVVEALIRCGAVDYFGETRSFMLGEYEIARTLSAKQAEVFVEIHSELAKVEDTISLISIKNKRLRIGKDTKRVLEEIKGSDSRDLSIKLELWERFYFGIPLITSRIEEFSDQDITHSIGEINKCPAGDICIIGILESASVIKSRKDNKEMAFLKISDRTGQLDGIVVFSDLYTNCFYNRNILKRPENEVLKIKAFKKIDEVRGESIIAKSIDILG